MPRHVWWGAGILILATVAAYGPVFSAGFIWDDDAYVTNNPLLSAPDGWRRIWFSTHTQSQYFPLVFSTLRLEYACWGLNPVGYHAVNVAAHLANVLLIWRLLARLAVPGAWLAAAIFAVHPVQVETVAWVTELKNTESTFFYLLTLLAWLRFCEGRSFWNYGLALGLALLALLAKTTACTLPAAMLLIVWLRNEPVNWQSGWRRVGQVLPFLLLGLGLGLLSIWWEKHLSNYQPKYHLLGGPLDRLLIATRAIWFYAGTILWPTNLTFSYPHWEIDSNDRWQYVWLGGCLLVAAGFWRWRQELGRKPVAGGVFFVAALSPMLGFIPLYTFLFSYVADHYQYLAALGLMALFAAGATRLAARWPWLHEKRRVAVAVLLGLLVLMTRHQCGAYQNLETLWRDTLKKNPRSWLAHTNLGRILAGRDDFMEAQEHYRTALEIYPAGEDIHYNYGNMLVRVGHLEEAVEQYQFVLQYGEPSPELYNNLGTAYFRLQRLEAATQMMRLAVQGAPGEFVFHYNLGNVLVAQKQLTEGIAEIQQAQKLEPGSEVVKKRLQALTQPAQSFP
jgi:protein O-mannosyl-transferase